MKSKVKLRPSGSARWLGCTGSLILSQRVEKVRSVDGLRAAAEGTCCHELLEDCINTGRPPEESLGKAVTVFDEDCMVFPMTFYIDQEMVDGCNMFLDWIRPYKGEGHSEIKMQHSEIPALRGTCDYANILGTHAFVDDLKYGKSSVTACSRAGVVNPQLMCYTSLLFDKFPILETARVSIVQPRRKTKKKILSTDVTRQDITDFIDRVKDVGVLLDEYEKGEVQLQDMLQIGSYCHFCEAKNLCSARKKADAERFFDKI